MLNFIKSLIGFLLFLISGPRIMQRLNAEDKKDITTLFVKSASGYTFTLFCEKIDYLIVYKRFFIPNYVVSVYKIYSVLDGEHQHKELFKEEIILPKLTGLFLNENKRRQLLLEAYIDIISTKFVNA